MQSTRGIQGHGAWVARPQGCNGRLRINTSLTGIVSSWRGRESTTRCRHWLLQMVPLLLLLRWARPLPPGGGEDSGDAASDAARFYSTPLSPEIQDEMEAEPAPSSAAGPSSDGVRQRLRWEQDSLASEDRLMARMDKMQSYTHQAAGSSDAALR